MLNLKEAKSEVQWLLDQMDSNGGELYGVEYSEALESVLDFLEKEVDNSFDNKQLKIVVDRVSSKDLILLIYSYCKRQGVDFETATRMLNMMYEDGIHLE